jgi:hypothetical protein
MQQDEKAYTNVVSLLSSMQGVSVENTRKIPCERGSDHALSFVVVTIVT